VKEVVEMRLRSVGFGACACALIVPLTAAGAEAPQLAITRVSGPIELDGALDDAGWRGALVVDRWYETEPGDNIEPRVRNRALLAYDDRFLYVGLELGDPDPSKIRTPLTDRDVVLTSNDYAGIIIDSRHDGKTAQEFLANPRGVQYDLVWSDTTGEDIAPDFYWDVAAAVTATGWNLELRIPFSSLRFDPEGNPTFGVILFRNYPREYRYNFSSVRLPRDVECFVCNAADLVGFRDLPGGSHWVAAPYVAGDQTERAEQGPGAELVEHGVDGNAGLDVKWNPNSSLAIDVTLNPDFSQVESDIGQIATNQRFALFFPEKRTFFLEGADLFTTPVQAFYTRTITEPRGGLRATGRWGETSFTTLALQDRGGGLVVLPGPTSSEVAPQDFESDVYLARLRRDFGRSFLSVLATGREIDGGGSNWVYGPDLEWRPSKYDTVRAQWLWSRTETPDRPELTPEWDGRELDDTAGLLEWNHSTDEFYWNAKLSEIGDEFRADNGFVPQVGYRDGRGELGYQWNLDGAVTSLTLWGVAERAEPTASGASEDLLDSHSFGIQAEGKYESTFGILYVDEEVFVTTKTLPRKRPFFAFEISPGSVVPRILISGFVGDEIDFDNEREGDGGNVKASATLRLGDHVELKLDGERTWLDVDAGGRDDARLFTSELWRVKATYNMTARAFLRAIGQWTDDERDPSLYTFPVEAESAGFESSVLLAYKLNWQTVFYIGYSGLSEEVAHPVTGRRTMEPTERRYFVKLSYALQR
jgi:hypothetical protein